MSQIGSILRTVIIIYIPASWYMLEKKYFNAQCSLINED